MNKLIVIVISACLFSSCLDLSSSLFNPTEVEEYEFDKAESSFDTLPSSYDILADEVNEFSVTSTYDGIDETIYGVYLGDITTIDQDTVILYCHGNAGNMDTYFSRTKLLYNANGTSSMGILTYDYRGFGKSTGETTVESLYADTEAIIQWAKSQGVQEDRLFIYGFSLGSIPAVYACHNNLGLNPKKLMLEAPIGSLDAMAEDGSGLSISSSYVASAQVDNIEDIKKVKQDLYWLHGIDDDFLAALTHGEPVYNNHEGDYKVPHLVTGGNHGDTPFVLGIETYVETIENFVNR